MNQTNCIVIGELSKTIEKKSIVLKLALSLKLVFNGTNLKVEDFKNAELICKDESSYKLDIIFCYDDNRFEGILFLGHWNDGII